ESGALFIMNDRPDLAVLAEADGVHVGQGDLTAQEARRIVGGDKLVGVSTHSIEQARQAVLDGADYIGVGPVFSSRTKEFDEFSGLEYVQQVASEITLPAFAIGGIGVTNLREVLSAGASRVAVSSEICAADDVERVAARMKESLLAKHA
ncbi:MAG: thiamine phosphate synthase, partial [Alphaproteobacteria bacterium]